MPTDYTTKQGDSVVGLTDTLTLSDGTVPDFTGATVQFIARALTSPQPLILTGPMTFTNIAAGAVEFIPGAADNGQPGRYQTSWVVTFPGGGQMTWPTSGYNSWTIEENLTTPGGQQLVGLPDVKDYLNITASDRVTDAKLIRFIEAVTPVIEGIVGPVIVRTFEEWHSGGQYFIQLRRRPSRALGTTPVLSLLGCEEFRGPIKYALSIITDPEAATIYSVMLDPETATVYRRSTGGGVVPFAAGPWGGGMPDAVHVAYEAGQQTVPANVQEGTLELLRVNYRTTQEVGRGRQTVADLNDQGTPLGFFVPRRVRELLAPNRRAPSIA